jgi:hypothetical protein
VGRNLSNVHYREDALRQVPSVVMIQHLRYWSWTRGLPFKTPRQLTGAACKPSHGLRSLKNTGVGGFARKIGVWESYESSPQYWASGRLCQGIVFQGRSEKCSLHLGNPRVNALSLWKLKDIKKANHCICRLAVPKKLFNIDQRLANL